MRNQCEFEPRFPLNKVPTEPPTAAPRRGLFLYCHQHPSGKRGSPQDLLHPPVEGRGGYKKARNTRADFDPEGKEISVSSNPVFCSKKVSKEPPTARFRIFAALWQTIISKKGTTNTWNGRPHPKKPGGQPGKSSWTPTGNGWPKNARSADGPCQSFRRASIITSLSVSFRSARTALT